MLLCLCALHEVSYYYVHFVRFFLCTLYVVYNTSRVMVDSDLARRPVEGFSAGLVDDSNIFEWNVAIIGPPDTL